MRRIIFIVAVVFCLFYSDLCFGQQKGSLDPPKWIISQEVNGEVLLSWQMPAGALKTIIYRKVEGEENFITISQDALGFFMDKEVLSGIYVYKLQTIDSGNNKSNFSDERYVIVEKAKSPDLPCLPPIWTETFRTPDKVLLRWDHDCASIKINGYNIYRKLGSEKEFKLFQSIVDRSFKDVTVPVDQSVSYKACPLDSNLKELECSLPIDMPVTKGGDAATDANIPIPEFVVRKTNFERFLTLPDGKTFKSPTDIKVDIIGRIYVSDTGSGLIHVFDRTGEYEKSIGREIKDDGSIELFETLLGIDVDNRGIIYGVDAYKGVLKAFDQRGQLLFKIILDEVFKEYKEYNFIKYGIVDVIVDYQENWIYLIDNFNNHIYKFDPVGKLNGVLLKKGQKYGEIQQPTLSYLDEKGNIWLSDTMNQRISVFNANGEPQMVFGKGGDVLGTFIRPKGIGMGRAGNVYVADSYTNCIQVFSPDGAFKYILGDKDGKQLDIATPNGIFVDRNDKLYVVEKLINRIQVLQLTDQYVTIK